MRPTEYIKRWWQRKGFGIQSKTDFAFLHHVVREELPYYAYKEWQEKYPLATTEEQQFARLLLRLSNSLRPGIVRIHGNAGPLVAEAIGSGCRRTTVEKSDTPYFKPQYADTPVKSEYGTIIEFLTDTTAALKTTAVILTDIDSYNAAIWQQLLTAQTITYDMKHTGIALMHQGRYPEHYYI